MTLKELLNAVQISGDIKITAWVAEEREEKAFIIASYDYDDMYDGYNVMVSKIPDWCMERKVRCIDTYDGFVRVELEPIRGSECNDI